MSQPLGRGVKPVGTKSQIWQRKYFLGSPNWYWWYLYFALGEPFKYYIADFVRKVFLSKKTQFLALFEEKFLGGGIRKGGGGEPPLRTKSAM